MDELIKAVSDRAGIDAEQATRAVHAVIDHVNEKMPGMGEQLRHLLAGGGGGLSEAIDSVRKKFGF
jgi:hypothetical protein